MKPQHITNKQTAAQAIVNCMKIEKVRHVFCVPGESYLPILDALYDSPTIDVISARHEGGGCIYGRRLCEIKLKTRNCSSNKRCRGSQFVDRGAYRLPRFDTIDCVFRASPP